MDSRDPGDGSDRPEYRQRRHKFSAENLEIDRSGKRLESIAKIAQPLQALIDVEKSRLVLQCAFSLTISGTIEAKSQPSGQVFRTVQLAMQGRLPPAPKPPNPASLAAERRNKLKRDRERAKTCWRAAKPIATGDPVDRYLRARCPLPTNGQWSPMLRCTTMEYRERIAPQPIEPISTPITQAAKPPCQTKKLVGPPANGAIRLEPIADDGMVVAGEGIETTLACHGLGFGAAICGISLAHMAGRAIDPHQPDIPDLAKPAMLWPAGTQHVILLRDADSKDPEALNASLRRIAAALANPNPRL